jgi:hypothetical protein
MTRRRSYRATLWSPPLLRVVRSDAPYTTLPPRERRALRERTRQRAVVFDPEDVRDLVGWLDRVS